jgi:hypothetical protein
LCISFSRKLVNRLLVYRGITVYQVPHRDAQMSLRSLNERLLLRQFSFLFQKEARYLAVFSDLSDAAFVLFLCKLMLICIIYAFFSVLFKSRYRIYCYDLFYRCSCCRSSRIFVLYVQLRFVDIRVEVRRRFKKKGQYWNASFTRRNIRRSSRS